MQCKVLIRRRACKSRHGFTKTLLVMKLTSILILGACLQISAHVHSQTVSFSGKDVPLEKVFAAVEKQTGYVFFFDEAILKDARPVTIRAENDPLSLFLSRVLSGQPLKFSFQNKTIIISRREIIPAPALPDTIPRPSAAQTLLGVVMDMNTAPLAGASVTVEATGKSTITDGRGAFTIPAPAAKSKILISYVGYQTREVILSAGQQQLFIQLAVAVNVLDEEVVQAYGKTSQRLSVANITRISGEEIQKQPVMNPLLALNGRMPGVSITPVNGYISAPVKVEVRGRNTVNPALVADPLYVIDGVPLTILDVNVSFNASSYKNGSTGFFQAGLMSNTQGQSPLFSVNPADIESISVLKDAAATAIYGSRGANGVILITTKRTKPGKTRLDINVQQSISTVPRHWDMPNTSEYLQMRREALKNDGLPVNIANIPELAWDTTQNTDWQKEFWGVAKSTDASISLSGGDRNTSFNLGAGYNESQDITTLNGTNQRINISTNLTHRSSDQKLTVNLRALYTYTYVKAISSPTAITAPPNAPRIFNEKGDLNYAAWTAAGIGDRFPFSGVLVPSGNSTNFINAGLRINYNLIKGLNLSINAGYSNAQSATTTFNPMAAQNPAFTRTGLASFGNSTINNLNIEPEVNYTSYIGSGRLELLAGGTYQNSTSKGATIVGSGYTNDALLQSISNAAFIASASQQAAQKKYASIHGRINYNWLNKYILEFTGNRDGSSNFGPGRQFGNFWSVGGAWIASEEAWAKRLLPSWWSFFKLNASYGVTGLDGGGAYQYLSQWKVPSLSGAAPAYNGIVPMTPYNPVNQDYQWQETKKINADLSLGFLDDKITLTLSWYRNRCNNQLTNIPTPVYTGFSSIWGNSPANVENSGWEGSINAKLITTKDFSWTLGFNIGINRNKLLSYPNFEFSSYYLSQKIGVSLNTIYLFHHLGINPQTGARSYEDYNHDGVVSQAPGTPPATGMDDKYVALDVTPRYVGGFSHQFSYKRFMLSLFCTFKKQMAQLPYTGVAGGMGNIPQDIFDSHWQQPGDQTIYPRFTTSTLLSNTRFAQSDGSYTDASFVRLSNLSFTYSLPEKVCKKLHMQGLSFSLNTSNLFIITGYPGIDPDVTYGSLPQPRTIAGKISFNF
jgi:TonB-linked SusC/RagA family outer membrane protein